MTSTVLVDLNGLELAPRACGSCQGSSSDNKIRAKIEDKPALPDAEDHDRDE